MKLLVFLFAIIICAVTSISLPDVFHAETKVTSTAHDQVTQHDFVWVDQINERMHATYHFGDDERTLIYRGDLQKEFYLHDGICGWVKAPETLNFNLQLPSNLTKVGDTIIDGVLVEHYYLERGLNSVANYYFDTDGNPFRFQFIEGETTTVDFLKFSKDPKTFPKDIFDEPDMDCNEIDMFGVNDRYDLHNTMRVSKLEDIKPPTFEAKPVEKEQLAAIDPATLALIGKTAWFIIQENKAEANLDTIANAIIPDGATWSDMAGWTQQRWNGWEWTLTNLYGVDTVNFKWGFNFLCGGDYKGVGMYIENAAVIPKNIYVMWGYKVNVRTSLLNPFNSGSRSSPVAGITMSLTMDTSTLVNTVQRVCTVNLMGHCGTELISCSGYKSDHFLYF